MTPKQTARLKQLRNPVCYYDVNGRKCLSLPFGTELAGRGEKGERYTEDVETYGTLVQSSEDARGNDHTGWYADNWQSSLIKFGVVRVRHSRGCDYVPVTWSTGADGATYHFRDSEQVPKGSGEEAHRECMQDVMVYADRCAEIQAEDEREYHAKDQAEQQAEETQELIQEATRRFCFLFRSRKHIALNSPAWQDTRRWMSEQREIIREAKEKIASLADNYWLAVEGR